MSVFIQILYPIKAYHTYWKYFFYWLSKINDPVFDDLLCNNKKYKREY